MDVSSGITAAASSRIIIPSCMFIVAGHRTLFLTAKSFVFPSLSLSLSSSDFAVTVASSHPLSRRDYYRNVLFVPIEPTLPNK